jgi:hypothetical protein
VARQNSIVKIVQSRLRMVQLVPLPVQLVLLQLVQVELIHSIQIIHVELNARQEVIVAVVKRFSVQQERSMRTREWVRSKIASHVQLVSRKHKHTCMMSRTFDRIDLLTHAM